jgi:hypothetical protein
MTLKFLALQGAPYIYDTSRLRVNLLTPQLNPTSQCCLRDILIGILICKGLTERRLYKSFDVKGLPEHWNKKQLYFTPIYEHGNCHGMSRKMLFPFAAKLPLSWHKFLQLTKPFLLIFHAIQSMLTCKENKKNNQAQIIFVFTSGNAHRSVC